MLLAIMVGSVPYRLRMASRLVRLRRKRVHNGETELGVSESTDDVVLVTKSTDSTRRHEAHGDDTKDALGLKAREDLKSAKRCHAHVSVPMGTVSTIIVARLERWIGLLARRPEAGVGEAERRTDETLADRLECFVCPPFDFTHRATRGASRPQRDSLRASSRTSCLRVESSC